MRFLRVILIASLFVLGCESKSEPVPVGPATPPAVEAEFAKEAEKAAEGAEKPAEGAATLVEVSKEGTKFDPPVEKAQIPKGAWICDMGTVHYARAEQGDGTCPVCNMKLKEHK